MNPRVTTGVVGAITVLLGLFGLFYPERAMALVGYSYVNASHVAGTLGEVRAVYGGMVLVAGIYTVLAAMDPWAHRGRLFFLGCLWLGAFGGRLFGVVIDGGPGLFGWMSLVLEAGFGGALLLSSQATEPGPAQSTPSPAAYPPV